MPLRGVCRQARPRVAADEILERVGDAKRLSSHAASGRGGFRWFEDIAHYVVPDRKPLF